MLKYILKRLLAGVLTMVVLITVAFFMMHAMPGGPFSPSEEKNVPIEVLEHSLATLPHSIKNGRDSGNKTVLDRGN